MCTPDQYDVGLSFPQNIAVYLSNMVGLGLLEVDRARWLSDVALYAPMEGAAEPRLKKQIETMPQLHGRTLQFRRGIVEFSAYGEKFMSACVWPALDRANLAQDQ
jgi:hypothetical protein